MKWQARGKEKEKNLARVTAREVTVEAVLMHDPFGLLAPGSSAFVEDEGLLHTEKGS